MKVSEFAEMLNPQGCWFSILAALGVPAEYLGKNRPCPFCGGTDRFTVMEPNGNHYCRKCPARGNGYEFVKRFLGIDYPDARRRVVKILRSLPPGVRQQMCTASSSPRKASREHMDRRWVIWDEKASIITPHDPVYRYLHGRLGFVPQSTELRTLRDLTSTYMVARVRACDGAFTLHHTDVVNPNADPKRRFADGPRPIGSSVQIAPMDSRRIVGVAEGIETACAASSIFGVPVWAALSKHGIGEWRSPDEAIAIMIFPDNDADGGSMAEAKKLQARCDVPCRIHMPERIAGVKGADWADVLMLQRGRE
jgi:putative DNA primase/helicase